MLAKCVRSRLVEDTLLAVTQNLDTLREGMQLLGLYSHDLTEARLEHLKRVDRVRAVELEQLAQVGLQQEVARDWHEVEKQLDGSKPWLGIDDVTEAADRIRTRYVEARRAYLDKQEELFEELRGRVVRREGYNTLDADQADNVLRPLREARCDTTEEAISPPLAFLRDSVPNRLKEALEESNRRMDEFLDHVVVVQVKIQSRGREFGTVEEVEAWISELRGRLLDQLKPGVRVRLT